METVTTIRAGEVWLYNTGFLKYSGSIWSLFIGQMNFQRQQENNGYTEFTIRHKN